MSHESSPHVRLRFPLFTGVLCLQRTPKYLRFTCSGIASCSRHWDALDQLNDVAHDGERLFAAVLVSQGTVHVDRTVKGRRVGEWHRTADYEPITPQPPGEVMRDTERWREWCMDREREAAEKGAEA